MPGLHLKMHFFCVVRMGGKKAGMAAKKKKKDQPFFKAKLLPFLNLEISCGESSLNNVELTCTSVKKLALFVSTLSFGLSTEIYPSCPKKNLAKK